MTQHTIKVLGTGCSSCKRTTQRITEIATELGADVEVIKVEDLPTIMGYGIMSTPGVVIDERVVHAGGVPSPKVVRGWLEALT